MDARDLDTCRRCGHWAHPSGGAGCRVSWMGEPCGCGSRRPQVDLEDSGDLLDERARQRSAEERMARADDAAFADAVERFSADDLVGVLELAQRADVATATVHSWRRRHADFPEPVVVLSTGPVWRWTDVAAWIAVPRPTGRPRTATRSATQAVEEEARAAGRWGPWRGSASPAPAGGRSPAPRVPRRSGRASGGRLGWHRDPAPDGTPQWYAEMGGVRVAEAVMTGRSGVDNCPWDWGLTDNGLGLQIRLGKTTGVADTLRSAKEYVQVALSPDVG